MRRKASRRFAPLLAGSLLLSALPACQARHEQGAAVSAEPSANAADADRNRAIEDKKAEIDRMAADIQTMQGTEQEKIDAVGRLDQARRELNALAEGGSR